MVVVLEGWNESVSIVAELSDDALKKFLFVEYERLYEDVDAINEMYAKLGLDPVSSEKVQKFVDKSQGLKNKLVPRRDDFRSFVCKNADWDSYRKLCSFMD